MKDPKTKHGWALYRAVLNCQIGQEALDGKSAIPDGVARESYALYCLLKAVGEIAQAALLVEESDDQP